MCQSEAQAHATPNFVTVYEGIPDRVKSLFWSIASVVYLHRPLHVSTILGVQIAVRDCSRLEDGSMCSKPESPSKAEESAAEDKEFLRAMNVAATDYLRRNTKQLLHQPDRNMLTKQVIQVLFLCVCVCVCVWLCAPVCGLLSLRVAVCRTTSAITAWKHLDRGFCSFFVLRVRCGLTSPAALIPAARAGRPHLQQGEAWWGFKAWFRSAK